METIKNKGFKSMDVGAGQGCTGPGLGPHNGINGAFGDIHMKHRQGWAVPGIGRVVGLKMRTTAVRSQWLNSKGTHMQGCFSIQME